MFKKRHRPDSLLLYLLGIVVNYIYNVHEGMVCVFLNNVLVVYDVYTWQSGTCKINAVLLTNPVDSIRRQELSLGFHTKLFKFTAVPGKPAIEGALAHSCSIRKFVFIGAFHGILIYLQVCGSRLAEKLLNEVSNTQQSYNFSGKNAREKPIIFTLFCQCQSHSVNVGQRGLWVS